MFVQFSALPAVKLGLSHFGVQFGFSIGPTSFVGDCIYNPSSLPTMLADYLDNQYSDRHVKERCGSFSFLMVSVGNALVPNVRSIHRFPRANAPNGKHGCYVDILPALIDEALQRLG